MDNMEKGFNKLFEFVEKCIMERWQLDKLKEMERDVESGSRDLHFAFLGVDNHIYNFKVGGEIPGYILKVAPKMLHDHLTKKESV